MTLRTSMFLFSTAKKNDKLSTELFYLNNISKTKIHYYFESNVFQRTFYMFN